MTRSILTSPLGTVLALAFLATSATTAAAGCGAVGLGSDEANLSGNGNPGAGDGGSNGSGSGVGAACGSRGLAACAPELRCVYPESADCGRADRPGTCQAPLENVGCATIYQPVCGCDGKTYSNACELGRVAASLDHDGECATTPSTDGGAPQPDGVGQACGSRGLSACPPELSCVHPKGALCGRADAPGTCQQAKPSQACDAVYQPVCGCDGKTYGNECERTRAAVGYDYDGACR